MANQYNADKQRHIMAVILWYRFGYPLNFIAEHLGYKDHKAVMYVIKKVPTYIWRDVEYIKELKKII